MKQPLFLFILLAFHSVHANITNQSGSEECGLLNTISFSEDVNTCNLDLNPILTKCIDILSNKYSFHDVHTNTEQKIKQGPSCRDARSILESFFSKVISELLSLSDNIGNMTHLQITVMQIENSLGCLKTKITSLSSEQGILLNTFLSLATTKTSQMNKFLDSLEKQRLDLVISSVAARNYSSAAIYFSMLNHESSLDSVLGSIYTQENPKIAIMFATHILDFEKKFLALQYIYNQLYANTEVLERNIFLFDKVIKTEIRNNAYLQSAELQKSNTFLATNVSIQFHSTIDKMVENIIAGNLDSIISEYSSSDESEIVEVKFSEIFETLSTRLLNNSGGLNNIIRITLQIDWDEEIIRVLQFIIKSTNDYDIQIEVAAKVKRILAQNTKNPAIFSTLLDTLPSYIKAITFGGTCTIKVMWTNYLEAAEDRSQASDLYFQRPVLLTRTAESNRSHWILETINGKDGSAGMFKIRNAAFNEYLGALSPYEREMNGVRSSSNFPTTTDGFLDCECLYVWKVVVAPSEGDFYLYHTATNSYLVEQNSLFRYAVLRHRKNNEHTHINLICSDYQIGVV